MNIKRLLIELKRKEINLFLEDGKLKTSSAPGAITAEIAAQITANKADIIAALKQRDLNNAEDAPQKITSVNREEDLVLSYSQQRLWFVDKFEGSSIQYNMPVALKLDGKLNKVALEASIKAIVSRHEVLRTTFADRNGEPVQVVNNNPNVHLVQIDLCGIDNQQQTVLDMIAEEAISSFDLSTDLMLRVSLLTLESERHVLLATFHHIAADGWSIGVVIEELMTFYRAFCYQQPSPLPPLEVQYADYASWQRAQLSGASLDKKLSFWQQHLAGAPHVHNLPLDRVRPLKQDFSGDIYQQLIDRALLDQVKESTSVHEVTLFMLLQSVFALLLSRYSGEHDVVMGTPVAGRLNKALEPMIGFFVNTLVLRTRFDDEMSFASLLGHTKQMTLSVFEHQDIPYDMLVDVIRPQRSLSYSPLFQIDFSLQNNDIKELSLADLTLSQFPDTGKTAKFDLALAIEESDDGLYLNWNYATSLFDRSTIARMAGNFEILLKGLVSKPQENVFNVDMLSEQERQLQVQWNNTAVDYPQDKCIHELFEAQVEQNPDRIALIFEEQQLTYGELNSKANQLAHYLIKEKQVKPDTLVGIYLERSLEMVIGILAIQKAGGAYVPLDPDYPEARLAYMLEDARLGIVLTQNHLCKSPVTDTQGLCLDNAVIQQQLAAQPTTNLQTKWLGLHPNHLSYVIYTSGSTGKPKGVMVEHQAIVNRIDWMDREYGSEPTDRILQKTPFSFDVSVWEFFWPLAVGAGLVLAKPGGHKDPAYLSALIRDQQITKLHFVPAMLGSMLLHGGLSTCTTLQQVFCSGEALPLQHAKDFQASCAWAELHNLYGPTEAAIDVSYWACSPSDDDLNSVPIGRAIQNIQLHVLNAQRRPVPQGVAGELHIGGVGLARGYLNRPDLTAEKFIFNQFHEENISARLYKTGDLVCWLPDGNLEFLGRIDDQVKIRGFRIELGEIESTLCTHQDVKGAIVVVKDSSSIVGDKRLIAYVVSNVLELQDESETSAAAHEDFINTLRQYLSQSLPDYMLPSAFVLLEKFPLTPNGKVDRKALPAPRIVRQELVELSTETEKILAKLWKKLLGLEQVNTNDNFFEVGGHSLLSMRLINEIVSTFSIEMNVKTLFENPKLRDLAQIIDNGVKQAYEPIAKAPCDIALPLSFSQQRLWFIDQLGSGGTEYNLPMGIKINGKLNKVALAQAINAVVERHEVLRSVYHNVDGKGIQVVQNIDSVPMDMIDLCSMTPAEQDERIMELLHKQADKPFDLQQDLMLRVGLICVAEEQHVLLLTAHHIATDGWSMGILVKEFVSLYQSFNQGKASSLPELSIQYADYAYWLRQSISGERLAGQQQYWLNLLADAPQLHQLPLDFPRPANLQFDAQSYGRSLPPQLAEKVTALAQQKNVTEFMLLQACYALLVGRWSGENDVVIGSPIAGRNHKDVEPLIGFFINILVLRTRLDKNANFDALLAQTKTNVLGAFEHRDVPLEVIIDGLHLERDVSHSPLFQLSFTFQNNENVELSIPELHIANLNFPSKRTIYDLSLFVSLDQHGLHINWLYNKSLFLPQTIKRLTDGFAALLASVVDDPVIAIGELPVIGDDEVKLLKKWQSPSLQPLTALNQSIQATFEALVEQTPDAIAVTCEGKNMTYAELNEEANKLAHYLIGKGCKANELIGILLERSNEVLIAIMGVLKSGAAYVPMDPDAPTDRIEYIIDDANIKVVLTQASMLSEMPFDDLTTVLMDEKWRERQFSSLPLDNVVLTEQGYAPDDLAYVIYTSGTTGNPKGVMIERASLLLSIKARVQCFEEKVKSFLIVSPFYVDASVTGIYWTLFTGGKLCIANKGQVENFEQLYRYAIQEQVSHFLAIPSYYRYFLDTVEHHRGGVLPLQWVISAGESISQELVKRHYRIMGHQCALINEYGPTEGTVWATYHRCLDEDNVNVVPIGKPAPHLQLHVLDQNTNLVPIGGTGELHLSGSGLARGYLNQPTLTRQSFITKTDGQGRSQRLYKTGDLVRYLDDGSIQYIGRMDLQVKVRGFRVELAEIENRILSHVEVDDAMVTVQIDDHQRQRLVAYIESRNPAVADSVRAQLKQTLPDYMLPVAYATLAEFPRSPSGKLNSKALPSIEILVADTSNEYQAPRNTNEAQLCAIWQDLLKVEKVGIRDNFFTLGGDSILSIQVVSRANQQGIAITTKALFEYQNIADMVEDIGKQSNVIVMQEAVDGEMALLPVQREFLHHQGHNPNHYNQSVLLKVPESFDTKALEEIMAAVLTRHDALRLRLKYIVDENGVNHWKSYHQLLDTTLIRASCIEDQLFSERAFCKEILTARCNHYQRSLDITTGPVFKMVHFAHQSEGRLFIVAHRFMVDDVSWRILLTDIEWAYQQFETGTQISLADKTSSYQQWGEMLRECAGSQAIQQEKLFWQAQVGKACDALPTDFEYGSKTSEKMLHSSTGYVTVSLNAEETEALLKKCNQSYSTRINELILAGVYLGLKQWSGNDSFNVLLEGHGRENIFDHIDVTHTVGWFTTGYPLVLHSDEMLVSSVIKTIKEQCRAIPQNGIGYGMQEQAASITPQLVFNYLGQFDQIFNADSIFQVAAESAGDSISGDFERRYQLGLNGMVAGGVLNFILDYSDQVYQQQTMEKVAGCIEDGLRAVINHCLATEKGDYTVSDFPLATIHQAQLDSWQKQYDIARLYPATPMQKGLHFHSQLDNSAYVNQLHLTLTGTLGVAEFRQAWQSVVNKYDIFRTLFIGEGSELHQLVLNHAELHWFDSDWSGLSEQQQQDELASYLRLEKQQGFDFLNPPLQRVSVFKLSDSNWKVVWSHHHILIDGWCSPLVYRDVMLAYAAIRQGLPVDQAPARAYEDYLGWLAQRDREQAREFWQQYLAPIQAPTQLQLDTLPLDEQRGYQEQGFELSVVETAQLQAFAREHKTTVNTLFQLAWAYLLHCYSGDEHVVFGTTISGRPAELDDVESIVGLFINTVPVRVSFDDNQSIIELARHTHNEFQSCNEYGFLPLSEIQKSSAVAPGLSLFDTLVVFANYPIDAALNVNTDESQQEHLTISETASLGGQTNYLLTLGVGLQEQLAIKCGYSASSFASVTISRLLGHLKQILLKMPRTPLIGEIDILTESEKDQLQVWSTTDFQQSAYPMAKGDVTPCIHELFESQAARTPNTLAIIFETQQLSYGELNHKANQLAHYLIHKKQVKPDSLVGICLERSLEMVISILAILKAGGAYVPLDPDYPEARLAFMLVDANLTTVITQSQVLNRIPIIQEQAVCLDQVDIQGQLNQQSKANPDSAQRDLNSNNLAYVIYTSGSTGQPKGVMIEHHSVVNLGVSLEAALLAEDSGAWGWLASYAFDASVQGLTQLCLGQPLVIIGEQFKHDPKMLAKCLQTTPLQVMDCTPILVEAWFQAGIGDSLPNLLIGGDSISPTLWAKLVKWQTRFNKKAFNVYGPTECTVDSTLCLIEGERPHIGKPLINTQAYILDKKGGGFAAEGVAGEVHIGGAGLARGYLNRPELTAQQFIANPFSEGARLYKSGDQARWLSDGRIEFLGRKDTQAKIRGFRIELGEVEAALHGMNEVSQCVAVVREQSQQLVAYVVPKSFEQAQPQMLYIERLREHLAQQLPDHMQPSAYMILPTLPLTSNGKLDYRALPQVDVSELLASGYVPAASKTQQILCQLWQQLLQLERVGIDDNFFVIGGDSILSIQLVSLCRKAGLVVSAKDILECQTVRNLSIRADQIGPTMQVCQADVVGDLKLLPIHYETLVDNAIDDVHQYNMSLLLTTPEGFDESCLEPLVRAIYRRHDALRLSFSVDEQGRWGAEHRPIKQELIEQSYVVEQLPTDPESAKAFISDRCNVYQSTLHLTNGPLFRMICFKAQGTDQGRLFLLAHHGIIDGISWRVLFKDLETSYQQYISGRQIKLADKTSSYQQWSERLYQYANSPELQREKDYWLTQASKSLAPMPKDYPVDKALGNTAEAIPVILDQVYTSSLLKDCAQAYQTEINELLLSAVCIALHQWTGERNISLMMEGHGRENLFADVDLSQTLGWFTSSYPLVLSVQSAEIAEVINGVKAQYAALPNHGIGYGILRYINKNAQLLAAASTAKSSQLIFNYLGQFDQNLDKDSQFGYAHEPTGTPRNVDNIYRPYLLGLQGGVMGGCLSMQLEYSHAQYKHDTMVKLGQLIEQSLIKVIDHCVTVRKRGTSQVGNESQALEVDSV